MMLMPGPGVERSAGFKERLEARQHAWPTDGNALGHGRSRFQVVMGHMQFNQVFERFDFEDNPRML